MPKWTALSFQDPSSPIIEQVLFFHDHIITILILITTLTMLTLSSLFPSNSHNNFINEGQEIEMIWTIIPAIILTLVAFPSINILYIIEDTKTPNISTKAIGHQWYWSYEHPTQTQTETENFLENSNIIRLINTSETLNLPVQETIRVLITSSDVIHSWTIPAMGSNVDALPGRINQTFIFSNRLGIFTGQCSEICGSNHSFIPIIVQFSSPENFINNIST